MRQPAAQRNLFYVKFRFILTITWASRDEFPRKILPILEFGVSIFGAKLCQSKIVNKLRFQTLLFKSFLKAPKSKQ